MQNSARMQARSRLCADRTVIPAAACSARSPGWRHIRLVSVLLLLCVFCWLRRRRVLRWRCTRVLFLDQPVDQLDQLRIAAGRCASDAVLAVDDDAGRTVDAVLLDDLIGAREFA